jgi:hypothetical protein
MTTDRVGKNPGLKNQPGGFFGVYWVFWVLLGFKDKNYRLI